MRATAITVGVMSQLRAEAQLTRRQYCTPHNVKYNTRTDTILTLLSVCQSTEARP